jgi:DNA topoisomerase-1
VLATAVRLLEITLIRVGNAQYAKQNRSYGLTTLHKRHLEVDGAALTFAFRGKSGVEHEVRVRDRRLAAVVRSLNELPGRQLFKYRGPDGDLCAVTSDDVNAYIREAMGEQFSAKDFRTWAGTVSAARALREMEPPTSPTDAKRKITVCVKAVAGLLGNTPTVCRSSYVHPKVFALFEAGELAAALPGPEAQGFEKALIKTLS